MAWNATKFQNYWDNMAEPKFVPKPGQVDFTNIRYAPVVNVTPTYQGKILLVQRSPEMRLYPNCWNGIAGFLDDDRSVEEKARQELREELGLGPEAIASIQQGPVLLQEAPEYGKTWLVVTMLARLSAPEFTLDWEAQGAQWFEPVKIAKLELLPGYEAVFAALRKMI